MPQNEVEKGSRVIVGPGLKWQGVGTVVELNNGGGGGAVCTVQWDCGRVERRILASSLLVKDHASSRLAKPDLPDAIMAQAGSIDRSGMRSASYSPPASRPADTTEGGTGEMAWNLLVASLTPSPPPPAAAAKTTTTASLDPLSSSATKPAERGGWSLSPVAAPAWNTESGIGSSSSPPHDGAASFRSPAAIHDTVTSGVARRITQPQVPIVSNNSSTQSVFFGFLRGLKRVRGERISELDRLFAARDAASKGRAVAEWRAAAHHQRTVRSRCLRLTGSIISKMMERSMRGWREACLELMWERCYGSASARAEEAEGEAHNLREEVVSLRARLEERGAGLARREVENRELVAACEEMKRGRDAASRDRDEARSGWEACERRLDEAVVGRNAAERRAREACEREEAAESERVAARAEATKAGQEREDLRRSLRKAQEALEGAELERSHLESEKQKLVAQCDALRGVAARAKTDAEMARRDAEMYREKAQGASEEAQEARNAFSTVLRDFRSTEASLSARERDLEAVREQHGRRVRQCAVLQAQVTELERLRHDVAAAMGGSTPAPIRTSVEAAERSPSPPISREVGALSLSNESMNRTARHRELERRVMGASARNRSPPLEHPLISQRRKSASPPRGGVRGDSEADANHRSMAETVHGGGASLDASRDLRRYMLETRVE